MPNGNVIGYSYGQIEEGPKRPTQQEMLVGKTSTVRFASLPNPNNLAGTIHSHPPDTGANGEDRDHRAQMNFMNGSPEPNAPAGAFSDISGGDIENNIRDQETANSRNPTPFQQEHYLMTSSGHTGDTDQMKRLCLPTAIVPRTPMIESISFTRVA